MRGTQLAGQRRVVDLRGAALATILAAAFILGVASPGVAQQPAVPFISLAGGWLAVEGDDPDFARPEWSSGDWLEVDLSDETVRWASPVVWYRRTVEVPAEWEGRPLALSLATSGSVRVYVDGQLAQRLGGSVGDGPPEGAGHHMFSVAEKPTGARAVIAVRTELPAHLVSAIRIWSEGFLFGPADVVPATARAGRQGAVLRRMVPNFAAAALFLLVALVSFGLYFRLGARRPELRAFPWYGGALLFLTGWELTTAAGALVPLDAQTDVTVSVALGRLAIGTMVLFLFKLLRPGPQHPVVWVVAGANLASGLLILLFGYGTVAVLGPPTQDIVGVSGVLVGLYVIIAEAISGSRSARIICGGFGLHASATAWALLGQMNVLVGPPTWLFEVAHLASLLSIALALVDRTAMAFRAVDDAAGSDAADLGAVTGADPGLGSSTTMADLLALSTIGSFTGSASPLPGGQASAVVDRDALRTGDTVGRYVVQAKLGRGGMGVVLHAHDPDLSRDVAIKLVASADSGSSGTRRQSLLHREAVAMARCTHPNIITIYDVGVHGDEVFLAMEYLQGITLRQWQGRRPRPAAHEIIDAYLDAGRGLSAAHRAGIVHGDFKADNVMYTTDERVVVLDFGIAQPATSDSEEVPSVLSDPNGVQLLGAGTPAFMAPELRAGARSTRASDQFAFSMSLFAGLFQVNPRAALEQGTSLEGLLSEGPADERPSAALFTALHRGMSAVPEERFESVDQLLEALEAARHSAASPVASAPAT